MQEQTEMALATVDAPQAEIAEMECGCRFEVDLTDQEPAVVLATCTEHDERSTAIDDKMRHVMGMELDIYVGNAAARSGKRVQRIMPVDPYRGR